MSDGHGGQDEKDTNIHDMCCAHKGKVGDHGLGFVASKSSNDASNDRGG